jgi:citrate lyase gamma subunit
LKDVKYNINTRYAIRYFNGSNFGQKLRPTDLREIIQKVDFKSKINKQLGTFWSKHKENWCTLMKAEFLSATLEVRDKGHLSQAGFEHLLSGIAPSLNKDKDRR